MSEIGLFGKLFNKDTLKPILVLGVFVAAWFLPESLIPAGDSRVVGALNESGAMLHEYAREHVLLCLVPAFFIAGAISVFVSQASVMKYLGPTASRWVAYPVAAVSGTVLAVCSCTVLPLFAGIHKRGAGLGPAAAFLYAGPAINVLAIILTARVLGVEFGVMRGIVAVALSVVIGLCMHLMFRREEEARAKQAAVSMGVVEPTRTLGQDVLYFTAMVGILVFANWGKPGDADLGLWNVIFRAKWIITGVLGAGLAFILWRWFTRDELKEWVASTWTFALQILPLLFGGVLVAGFLLGRPGHEGLIPSAWIAGLVGGNSVGANLFAAVSGALMYFATLTEVPILQGLMGSGMGKGPALTLALTGPALSLPSIIVIRQVLGTRKTIAYGLLIVGLSALVGMAYGTLAS